MFFIKKILVMSSHIQDIKACFLETVKEEDNFR